MSAWRFGITTRLWWVESWNQVPTRQFGPRRRLRYISLAMDRPLIRETKKSSARPARPLVEGLYLSRWELGCFVHIPHRLLNILIWATCVRGAPPRVLECIEKAKCDHRIDPKCRNHRIDAVNWSLCVVRWVIDTTFHLLEARFMRTHHNSRAWSGLKK